MRKQNDHVAVFPSFMNETRLEYIQTQDREVLL